MNQKKRIEILPSPPSTRRIRWRSTSQSPPPRSSLTHLRQRVAAERHDDARKGRRTAVRGRGPEWERSWRENLAHALALLALHCRRRGGECEGLPSLDYKTTSSRTTPSAATVGRHTAGKVGPPPMVASLRRLAFLPGSFAEHVRVVEQGQAALAPPLSWHRTITSQIRGPFMAKKSAANSTGDGKTWGASWAATWCQTRQSSLLQDCAGWSGRGVSVRLAGLRTPHRSCAQQSVPTSGKHATVL